MKKQFRIFRLLLGVALIAELVCFAPDVKAQTNIYRTPQGKEYTKDIFMQQWAMLNEFVQSFGNSKDMPDPTFRDYLLWMAGKWDVINKMPDTLKVEWLGWIQWMGKYEGIDPGFYQGSAPPTQHYDDEIEIGLREDGVIVFRRIGKK